MDLTEKWTYKPATVYELTIAPDDANQKVSKKDTRLRCCVQEFKETLEKWEGIKYHLFCEISHPQFGDINSHRYARIHWHGIIYFETEADISKFLLYQWHKITSKARVQLNPYRPDKWDDYCRKQKSYLPKHTRLKNASWDVVANPPLPPIIE